MKKSLSLLFAFTLMVILCTLGAFALSFNEASTTITLGAPVTSNIIEIDPEDSYLFELPEAGKLNISLNSSASYFTLTIYDAGGKKLWGADAKCGGKVYKESVQLSSGSYYLTVTCYNRQYGAYNLLVGFEGSGETFAEPQGGNNNSIVDAVNSVLALNGSYVSHISLNDYDDYFKVQLDGAGTISLNIQSEIETVRAEFYDGNSNKIWTTDVKFNGGSYSTEVPLNAGTYYFHLQRINANYGKFSFNFSFESAYEYVTEANGGSNNRVAQATPVEVNRDIGGIIAYNDTDDYYEINLSDAGTLTIQLTSPVESFKIEFLDSDGKKNFLTRDELASCDGMTYYKTLDFTAGKYFLRIGKNKELYGAYNLFLNFVPANEFIVEEQGGSNNTIDAAHDIQPLVSYSGNIGVNDISDYYCFSTAKAGETTISINSTVPGFTVRVLDAKGSRLVNEEAVCNGSSYSKTLPLANGIYYLQIAQCNDYTGNYNFNINTPPSSGERITSFGSIVSAWALSEIEAANEEELIPVYLKGLNLREQISRAEFAAISIELYENLTGSRVMLGKNHFVDISSNRFVNEIIKASNLGITAGTSDNTFSPNSLITREQVATMMCRAYKKKANPNWTLDNDAKYPLKYTVNYLFWDDVYMSSYAKEAVYFMAANGIINGTDDAGFIFDPQVIATREQAIIMALRCVKNLG